MPEATNFVNETVDLRQKLSLMLSNKNGIGLLKPEDILITGNDGRRSEIHISFSQPIPTQILAAINLACGDLMIEKKDIWPFAQASPDRKSVQIKADDITTADFVKWLNDEALAIKTKAEQYISDELAR